MKTLILNGSPRKGNTLLALEAIKEGIEKNVQGEVELLDITKYKVAGCIACDYCRKNEGNCLTKDDGQMLAEKILEADIVIFGSPVYWWGISAQLKLVIDRMYMKGESGLVREKKVGIVAVGAAELDDPEYEIISKQFKCICDYLGWELVIDESISAATPGDLEKDIEKLEYLKTLYKKFI